MNRRGFFGMLAAAPLVEVGGKEAMAAKAAPSPGPIVGELRHIFVAPRGMMFPGLNVAEVELRIWDGRSWVHPDSLEGVNVRNAFLRR